MGSSIQSLPEGSMYHIVIQRRGVSLHWGPCCKGAEVEGLGWW